jgi:hypothetical protein
VLVTMGNRDGAVSRGKCGAERVTGEGVSFDKGRITGDKWLIL